MTDEYRGYSDFFNEYRISERYVMKFTTIASGLTQTLCKTQKRVRGFIG